MLQLNKKKQLSVQFGSNKEIPARFYELAVRWIEDNGKKLIMNMDLLRETKNDPKVGSVIIQEMQTLQEVTIHSEFCNPNNMPQIYKRIVTMGRPDPSSLEKASSKKPSHSTTDMYHMMNGLRKNLESDQGKL